MIDSDGEAVIATITDRWGAMPKTHLQSWTRILRAIDVGVARAVFRDLSDKRYARPDPAEFSELCRMKARMSDKGLIIHTEVPSHTIEGTPMPEGFKEQYLAGKER